MTTKVKRCKVCKHKLQPMVVTTMYAPDVEVEMHFDESDYSVWSKCRGKNEKP